MALPALKRTDHRRDRSDPRDFEVTYSIEILSSQFCELVDAVKARFHPSTEEIIDRRHPEIIERIAQPQERIDREAQSLQDGKGNIDSWREALRNYEEIWISAIDLPTY